MKDELGPEPAVSVIMPIYNASEYLDQALKSVRGQTLDDLEIICVNDGSTDNSLDIIEANGESDSRIKIIDKPNSGYGASCNRGISAARGKWIAILEPDDWIDIHMFESMVNYADSFSANIDIVKTPYWRVINPDTDEQDVYECANKWTIKPTKQPFDIADPGVRELLQQHPSIWSALYSRSFLEDNAIKFHEVPGAGWADNPFLIDTLCRAKAIVYLDRPFYYYREQTWVQDSLSSAGRGLLPIERWHDMKDILDELHITNESILRAHNMRGFSYISFMLSTAGDASPEMDAAIKSVFDRMEDDLVFSDVDVSPAWKRRYASVEGVSCPKFSPFPYYRKRVLKMLCSIRIIGIKRTLRKIGAVLRGRGTWA